MPQPPKLPVWKTTRECYRLVFAHADDFIRISWLWILVMMPVYAAGHAAVWQLIESPERLQGLRITMLVSMLPTVVEVIFLAAIAVAWHKLILDKRPASTASLTLDQTTLRYTAWSFGVFFVPPLILTAILPEWPSPIGVAEAIGLAAVYAAVILTLIILPLRFCLQFPAVALDQPMTLHQSWQATQFNTLQLTEAALLCWLPSLLAFITLGLTLPDITTKPAFVPYVVVSTILSFAYAIPTIFGVTLFSLAYRHFVLTPHPLDSQGNLP